MTCFLLQTRAGFRSLLIVLAILVACGWASRADGTVIYLKSSTDPIVGYLVESNEDTVVIRQRQSNGTFKRVTLQRANIAQLLNPYDESRLSQLSLERLSEYRDYAEELAAKTIDPEAIDLAMRLYLIVAYHGEGPLQQNALRALIGMARTPQEERELRMIAYESDPSRNRFLLAAPKTTNVNPEELTEEGRTALLVAIEKLRQGERREAQRRINTDLAQQTLTFFNSTLTLSAFEQACQEETLSDEMLYTLLSIELSLLNPSQGRVTAIDRETRSELSSATWGESALRQTAPVRVHTLVDVTEFDPRESDYENGRWSMSPQRP